jgi:hypothetical protein
MEKQLNFVLYDEGIGENVITGNVKSTLDYIASYLHEAKDGESLTFEITRKDMTPEEIEAAPVI